MALRRILSCVALFGIAACEGLPDQPTCVWNPPAEPPPCHGEQATSSTFPYNGIRESEILGRVYRGRALLPNTLVHVRNSDALEQRPTVNFPPATVYTNAGGLYRVLQIGPRYDVLAVNGRDVLAREGITSRYFEPVFDGVGTPRAWSTHVTVRVDNRTPGRSLRFFAGGAFVYGSSGDVTRGLDVLIGEFTSKVVLHVVEVPDGGDLLQATASASSPELDLRVDAASAVTFTLAPLTDKRTVSFVTKGGVGFVPGDVQLRLDFGVYDTREVLGTVPMGQVRELVRIPNFSYTAQVKATNALGELDSGQVFYEPGLGVELEMPAGVPLPKIPNEGATVTTNGVLATTTAGVFEHILEPEDPNQPTITIGSAGNEAHIPDLAHLVLPRATGIYRWRVRAYPAIDKIDALSGVFLRAGKMATSAPRTIELR